MKKISKEKVNSLKQLIYKRIFIILIIAIVPVLIAGIIWYTFLEEGIWDDSEPGKPSAYTSNTTIDVTNGIVIDKEPLIKEYLKNKGFSDEQINNMTEERILQILDASERLKRDINSLAECTEAEILWCMKEEYRKYLKEPNQLEYLLNAELVTQYPRLDSVSSDKINGIIQFDRIQINDSTGEEQRTTLQFISETDFESKFNNYKTTGNKEVFNYFTLDAEGNAVVATWEEKYGKFESNNTIQQERNKINEGYDEQKIKDEYDSKYQVTTDEEELIIAEYATYEVDEKPINYKSMVEQYTLPFEYLWALLVMGESYDFVENLAGLAYNSQIIIGIYDSVTTTVDVYEKEYTENFREKYEEYEKEEGESDYSLVSETEWTEPPESYSYYAKNQVTTQYNNPQIDIVYANTWIVEMILEYSKIIKDEEPVESTMTTPDEEWSDNGKSEDKHTDTRTRTIDTKDTTNTTDTIHTESEDTINQDITNQESKTEENYKVYIKEVTYKEKKITNQSTKSILNMHYNKFERTQPTVTEKTDIDGELDNFVEFLRDNNNAYMLLTNQGVMNWLTDVLEQNQSTINMVDLTLYLLNKTKDPDNTELSFEFFSIFSPGNFSSVSQVYGNSIAEKLWFALIDAGYSEYAAAGALGNMQVESGIISNNLQDSCVERLGSDIEYTNKINSGNYSLEDFMTDGAGYGICQWTTADRKKGLYEYTVEQGYNIDSVDKQILYFLAEITGKGEAANYISGRRTKGSIENEGITSTHDDWANAKSVEDATLYFMRFFESPNSKDSLYDRQAKSNEFYIQLDGKEKTNIDSSKWTQKGVNCPQYKQYDSAWANIPYNYGVGKTIKSGGCGACALSMAVSGLTKSSVTPDVIVAYLNSINTNTVYNGYNSAKAIAGQYGLTFQQIDRTDKTSVNAALDAGKCLIFSIKANGIYTGNGHYIMCYGRSGNNYYVLESGNYYVPDKAYQFNQVFTYGSQGIFVLGR